MIEKTRPYQEKYNKALTRILFFTDIWNKRPHKSEISGTPLGKEPSSAFFHHILPKSKFPQGELDPENIILLTIEEHENVEIDMYRYDEINTRRTLLLKKYHLI